MKSKNETPKKSSASTNIILIVGAVLLMSGIIWITLESNRSPRAAYQPEAPPLVATLSPEMFAGKVRDAYQAAKDIPEILRYLPCFCGCFGPEVGHKSNLYCFADRHGEVCAECQDIALIAKQMNSEGSSLEKIGEAIRARFAGGN